MTSWEKDFCCLDPSLLETLDLSLQIGKIAQKQRGQNRWANPLEYFESLLDTRTDLAHKGYACKEWQVRIDPLDVIHHKAPPGLVQEAKFCAAAKQPKKPPKRRGRVGRKI